ncbi:hypothetical protein FACS18948_3950 [Clostridia bacterium]|nr:hypothetical protein FACS18948_3950 [Clostridia bacterium]
MKTTIGDQILAIRDSGETNMMDYYAVLRIAEREDYTELAEWMPTHKENYGTFILFGDEEQLIN